ncbi:3-isopropylmalate dehydratase small subunit [Mariprofundus sp. EBB-1]|uniref:3-isopropylmalate dehydratase small subunit n=1 Tax=Mariprofundus sp. EBB-1 TaxID=2650971 RepID=UPI000EF24012|nr:3-isopropylmalate dehydratase small subunit [Mariprofundus sp. EBB-1]RLL55017.1 3-isopropylmalate dehydratase small subunit [Mariprofundus sp. EBB-1]
MQAFTTLNGLVAPMDRANVDTDAIIPKQFLKSIKRTGYGPFLFDEWRYEDHGEPEMDCTNRPKRGDFILNQARYQGAQILLARENFGCGSSREHAPWAIVDYGFSCVIAPSFADIFYNNCFKNGILPIVLDDAQMDTLFDACAATEGFSLSIDLPAQTVSLPSGQVLSFEVDDFRKHCLLNGLDDIGLTLQNADIIRNYEATRIQTAPWLF